MLTSRQMAGATGDVSDRIIGTEGYFNLQDGRPTLMSHDDKQLWRYSNPKGGDMYNNEHKVLNSAIRSGKVINTAKQALNSTAAAVMGRISAYSGQKVTFAQFVDMKEDLFPKDFKIDMDLPFPEIAMPGRTKIV